MTAFRTLIGIITFVGCIAIIITLVVVLTRDRNGCGITSSDIRITEFTFTKIADGVVVTWPRPPEFSKCHPLYEVTTTSSKGTFSTTVGFENVLIPDNRFCFEVDISVRPLASTSRTAGGRTSYYDVRPVAVEFSIPIINPTSEFIVRWTHPNERWCFLQFMVKYQTDSETQVVDSARSEARFNFEYCMPSTVTIWPINPNNGDLLSHLSATTIDATQYPSTIDNRNINITSYDDRLEMFWSISSPGMLCQFSYRVEITTDMGAHTIYTEEPNITLMRHLFCFRITVVIQALIGENVMEVTNTGTTYGMPNVTDIVLTASSEEGTLTATWASNPLEEQCNIIYDATFENEIQRNTYRVSQSNATTELFYCVNTTVSVIAIHGDIVSIPNSVVFLEEYPSSLAPIEEISINRTGTSMVISWEPQKSVERCNDLYTVTAIKESMDDIECTGTTSCELDLSDPCPYTNFTIRPTPPIVGEEQIGSYICSNDDLL